MVNWSFFTLTIIKLILNCASCSQSWRNFSFGSKLYCRTTMIINIYNESIVWHPSIDYDYGRALIWCHSFEVLAWAIVYIEVSVCPSPTNSTLFHSHRHFRGKDLANTAWCLVWWRSLAFTDSETVFLCRASPHTRLPCVCVYTYFFLYHTARGTHLIYHRRPVQPPRDVWED